MAAGTKTVKTFEIGLLDLFKTQLPSISGLADGTYVMSIVVASGVPTLVLTEPIADGTITIASTTSFATKNGVVTSKVVPG